MSLNNVPPGKNLPETFNVVIEIPMDSDPIKYEVDKESGAIFVDRFIGTAMHYPANYGYVPQTLSGDGDPVDILLIMPVPLIPGSVVRARPVGALKMRDEAGDDIKIVAVPVNKVTELYSNIDSIRQLPQITLDQIAHFFQHYKDLEKGKWMKFNGWGNVEEARQEILKSIQAYK